MALAKAIKEISAYNEEIARALNALADNFEYSKIVGFV